MYVLTFMFEYSLKQNKLVYIQYVILEINQ